MDALGKLKESVDRIVNDRTIPGDLLSLRAAAPALLDFVEAVHIAMIGEVTEDDAIIDVIDALDSLRAALAAAIEVKS